MKKLLCLLLCGFMCLCFSGCFKISIRISDADYARAAYEDDAKIAGDDMYDLGDTYTEHSDGRYWGGYEKFNGYMTFATFSPDENQTLSVELSLLTIEGNVKIVFVDAEQNVTTLVEYDSDTEGQYAAEINTEVELLRGENRFKVVGYDCVNVSVEFYYS